MLNRTRMIAFLILLVASFVVLSNATRKQSDKQSQSFSHYDEMELKPAPSWAERGLLDLGMHPDIRISSFINDSQYQKLVKKARVCINCNKLREHYNSRVGKITGRPLVAPYDQPPNAERVLIVVGILERRSGFLLDHSDWRERVKPRRVIYMRTPVGLVRWNSGTNEWSVSDSQKERLVFNKALGLNQSR